MRHEKKKLLYLQCQFISSAGISSAMQSAAGFFNAFGAAYIPAACQPRGVTVMVTHPHLNGLTTGSGRRFFRAAMSKNSSKMSSYLMKKSFRNMATWAIRKVMDEYPSESISLYELQQELTEAWELLCNCGEITIVEGGDK